MSMDERRDAVIEQDELIERRNALLKHLPAPYPHLQSWESELARLTFCGNKNRDAWLHLFGLCQGWIVLADAIEQLALKCEAQARRIAEMEQCLFGLTTTSTSPPSPGKGPDKQ
jgi:hypothetical protein